MERLSGSIADFYIKRKIIEPEEKEVYKCGVELILNDIVTFSIIIILSCLIGNVRFSIEFLLTFCLTRIFCGGYHAKKSYVCRFTMLITFLLVIFGSYLFNKTNIYNIFAILVISFVIILRLIPVRHPNKNLTEKMRKENRRKGLISFILFAMISIFIFLLFSKQDGAIISLTLAAVAVLAVVGTITNERK